MGADGQGGGTQAPLQLIAEVVPLVRAWAVDRTFSYSIPDGSDVSIGSLVRVPFGGRKIRAVVVDVKDGDPAGLADIASSVIAQPVAAPPMDQVLDWIARRYVTPRGVVYDRVVPPRIRVTLPKPGPERPAASQGQVAGYDGGPDLIEAIARGGTGLWCFQSLPTHDHGNLIAELISSLPAGQALVALPEVRWGSPVADRLGLAFPDLVRVDSSRDDAERAAGWLALAEGWELGVGSRSIVYAPTSDLRLLVIDEEANPSYKEDRSPRIDARRVAVQRARASEAICVSIADAHSMEHSLHPDARWVTPAREEARRANPNIEVVEMTEDTISRALHRAIATTLGSGGRVGLLANMSGFARALWCRDCRRSVRCPRCEAGVNYERSTRSARCPRCAFSGRAPDVCPTCGSIDLMFLGAGTERLEEQLAAMFPRKRVVRMDPQVLAGSETTPQIEDADIYVTTWIGTKSAFRPPVDLVSILDFDALARRPDFRAAENAYLALVEMARWAGPASAGGRLVVQTREATHHSIQAVVRADHRFFVDREAEVRKDLGYPPFTELIRLRSSGVLATSLMERIKQVVQGKEVRILGPVPVQVKGSEVLEMLLKCGDGDVVAERLRGILPDVPRGSTLHIDVDPR